MLERISASVRKSARTRVGQGPPLLDNQDFVSIIRQGPYQLNNGHVRRTTSTLGNRRVRAVGDCSRTSSHGPDPHGADHQGAL